jgi:hypothetical protein
MKGPARNTPCPCGSGRKYKQCCLRARRPGFDEIAETTAWRLSRVTEAMESLRELTARGEWEEAEAVCEQLRLDFPGEPVGDMALAGVRCLQGRWEEEAELSERAALECFRREGEGNIALGLDLIDGARMARERSRCFDEVIAMSEPFPPRQADADGWHPCVAPSGAAEAGPASNP